MDKNKMNYCKRLTKKCFGEEVRPNTGNCMIVFAIPLLVPGVTMTAVAFHDETGYARYSALHIFGIFLLALAILLIVVGILLTIRFKSRVAPDDALHVMSTHDKTRKDVNLDIVPTANEIEYPHKRNNLSGILNSSIPLVNYLIEKDYSTAKADQGVNLTQGLAAFSNRDFQGYSSSTKSLEDDSSSYSDSDESSSGSYTITDDIINGRPRLNVEPEYGVTKKDNEPLYSKSKMTKNPRPAFGFRNSRNTDTSSNNFFQYSANDNVTELRDASNNKTKATLPNSKVLDAHHEFKNSESELHQNDGNVFPTETLDVTNQSSEIQTEENSPESRPRLHGLSSATVLISCETLISSDTSVVPSEKLLTQHAVSLEENITDSCASVFSVSKESKTRANKFKNNNTKIGKSSGNLELNCLRSLKHSPYATRPYSFPARCRLSGSAHALGIQHSPNQTHSTRPKSSEGYSCSDQTLVSMTSVDPL